MNTEKFENVMKTMGCTIIFASIVETVLTQILSQGVWGPIFVLVTGVFAYQSYKRTVVLVGCVFAIISLVLMLSLSLGISEYRSEIYDFNACVSNTRNISIALAPLGQPPSRLSSEYHVAFYGSSAFFMDAGNCEIEKYDVSGSTPCYCFRKSGSCTRWSSTSCPSIFDETYLAILSTAYAFALILLILAGVYLILTLSVIFLPNTGEVVGAGGRGEAIPAEVSLGNPSVLSMEVGAAVVVGSERSDAHDENDIEQKKLKSKLFRSKKRGGQQAATATATPVPIQTTTAYPYYHPSHVSAYDDDEDI